uniref:DUF4219 domain-containing protein n=1 Tax=Physcomitrium patens TaxID=3218 RepID=A9RQU4_PHYPA|nr:hypothetical protein PHYPA_003439 [Physcomitrium patens]
MGTIYTVVSKAVMLAGPSNFQLWMSTSRSIFLREDLWDVVGEAPPATAPSNQDDTVSRTTSSPTQGLDSANTVDSGDPSTLSSITPTSSSKPSQDAERLRLKCQQASSILELSLQPELRVFVEEVVDPSRAWSKLESMYLTNTIVDTMVVLNKWESLQQPDTMDVMTFMTRVYDIQCELVHIGHPQTSAVIVRKILSRLPPRFHLLARQIRNERNIPSLKELSARLQMEEHHLSILRSDSEALVMQLRNAIY